MDENNLKSQQSAEAKSTDKFVAETEVVRKPPVLNKMTVEDSSDDSRDPTVQDRPLSEDLIKAAIAQKMVEEKQNQRKLIIPTDAQVETSD
ncbi:hypothetical protein [Iningainema tapete]|uniref:Uncharacterized protein n=1 Tax=Iningainema tapete BLCC-T55 TaxID=2748662 RepID=A0A8J6XKI4_9CYAN|nr:hypothetical protein [Iningainema tapete]MBD2772521.1 hypothetical protein [Iningainema tapete BLCC-T55]